MSKPAIKGWCPTVFEPMQASDGWLVSLKPRVAGWTGEHLRLIAEQAGRHGSGALLISHRAHLQVRGLSLHSASAFADEMRRASLTSASVHAERRRNVLMGAVLSPALKALAEDLERWLESAESLTALPAKFTFGVGTSEPADIRIHEIHMGQFCVSPDVAHVGVITSEPLAVTESLTHEFLRLSRGKRMRQVVDEFGAEALIREAGYEPELIAPVSSHERGTANVPASTSERSSAYPWASTSEPAVGPLAQDHFAIGAAFGRLDAARLVRIAEWADSFSTGPVRLTSARAFVLSEVRATEIESLRAHAQAEGFIVDIADPRLRIAACAGGSGCGHSSLNMIALAERLAPYWRHQEILHLSGCAKGCAYPRPAALTCVATDSLHRIDVVRSGRADAKASFGLPLTELAAFLMRFDPGRSS
jgi:precorrin-3B synthase